MSAAPDPLFLEFQDAIAGRYSLDRELGRGGMGIVYLAREVHLDRSVAIKLLPPERAAQPALRDRFLREARLAAKLSHPNIIPIHSVEDREGFVFYVMAFVDGETLAQRVGARGPLSSTEGTRVLREVAWALAYAHAQGLVHRDVKPDNILLEGATNRVLVADFGIAAAFAEASADGIAGTPEFMSPEQVLGAPLDARSDLYGLGATAFYAFSGRFPFEGANVTEVLAKQVTEPAPPLASVGVVVPRKLAALVDRCLAKDPAHRPVSAQSVGEQLGVAIEQRRELPVALRAFVRRNGRLDGGGTLIAAAAILPTSVFVSAQYGAVPGFATFFVGAVLLPISYFTNSAYKLSLKGFAHQDLAPAFASEMERAREELALERMLTRPGVIERWLPSVARVSSVMFGLTIGMTVLEVATGFRVLSLFGLGDPAGSLPVFVDATNGWPIHFGSIALLSTVTSIALAQRRRDIDTEFWSNLWLGRAGKALFAFARKLMGKTVPVSAMTHRATELSLGMAAEQLFESLPKATRAAIGDVPAILKRLQDDAQSLRGRYDDLQEALAAAGDVAESEGYADVRSARDEIHSRLGEAVGALETIRLNLLRLHAGSASVESLTTHLGIAAEVSEQVERLIAAHEEVDRSLRFPREIATTPV
jgi:serine/threonine-protein kinase